MRVFIFLYSLNLEKILFKMKNYKLFTFGALLTLVLTLSSCFKEGEPQGATGYDFMTVNDLLGTKVLKPDYLDYTFRVLNPEVLRDMERALLYFSLPVGVNITEGIKTYDVTVNDGFGIVTKNILKEPVVEELADTLRNDSVNAFDQMWVRNGYVNTHVKFRSKSGPIDKEDKDYRFYMDMVKEKVSNDTLYLRFNLNLPKKGGAYEWTGAATYHSFRIPSAPQLLHDGITPVGDSIVVAVSAKVKEEYERDNKIVYKYSKYKLSQY